MGKSISVKQLPIVQNPNLSGFTIYEDGLTTSIISLSSLVDLISINNELYDMVLNETMNRTSGDTITLNFSTGYTNFLYSGLTNSLLLEINNRISGDTFIYNLVTGHSHNQYLTGYTETDPIFSSSVAKNITTGDTSHWNTSYSWGNHSGLYSLSGHNHNQYLTGYTESDPIFNASVAKTITTGDTTNWNSKQVQLESGTNIKTINNQTLLGSGNIIITGESGVNYSNGNGITISGNVISVNETQIKTFSLTGHSHSQYLTGYTETDPIFNSSVAKNITTGDTTNWNSKQVQLESGVNIKTINNQSLLGSGDVIINSGVTYNSGNGIVISGNVITVNETQLTSFSLSGHNHNQYLTGYTETEPIFNTSESSKITSGDTVYWNSKQDKLTSGTNIKTINGIPLLGAGNINISGGTGGSGVTYNSGNGILIDEFGVISVNENQLTSFSLSGHVHNQYLTGYTETEPIFNASVAKNITTGDTSNWNESYSWGNHSGLYSLTGHNHNQYLTGYTETDPIFNVSVAKNITTGDTSSWNSKQVQLESGVNIKTVNNISLLGSGNIVVNSGITYNSGNGVVISGNVISINENQLTSFALSGHVHNQYLTGYTETDPIFNASVAKNITTGDTNHWNTSYSWGNHIGLYSLTGHSHDERYFTKIESDIRFVNVSGDTIEGNLLITGNTTGSTFTSTVSTGVSPLNIQSTTKVNNLNTDLLDGYNSDYFINTGRTISAGSGMTGGGNLSDNIILSHADTSNSTSLTSTGNTNGNVIQNVSLQIDTFGHVTGNSFSTYDLDNRYFTKTESDSRFVNASGDTINGDLTVNGNFNVSGNTFNVGTRYISGNTTVDGKFYVSGSTTLLGELYGPTSNRLSSYVGNGVVSGFTITVNTDNTKFDVSPGFGRYKNGDGNIYDLTYTGSTGNTINNLSYNATYISCDPLNKTIIQQSSPYTATQRRNYILLGAVVHSNHTSINVINNLPDVTTNLNGQLNDLFDSIRCFNISGNDITVNGTNLKINKTPGSLFKKGVGFTLSSNNPHIVSTPALTAPSTLRFRTQSGYETLDMNYIDCGFYDSGGTRTPLNSGFQIMHIALMSSNLIRIQYGQHKYDSMSSAEQSLNSETFVIEQNISENGLFRCALIVRNDAVDLTNTNQAKFINLNRFGDFTQSVGGIGGTTSLGQAYTNSINPEIVTNETNGPVSIKRGSLSDGDSLIEFLNGSGTTVGLVNGLGTFSGTSFVKIGGNSTQFLKGDGSSDSNVYSLTGHSHSQYLTGYTETDPIFNVSVAKNITTGDTSNWNSKQSLLESGVNIKTVNNISLLGSGNITITGGSGSGVTYNSGNGITISGDVITVNENQLTSFALSGHNHNQYLTGYTETEPIFNASVAKNITTGDTSNWNSKQVQLESGTNIKTVNGVSLLGSGDIVITGSTSGTGGTSYVSGNGIIISGDVISVNENQLTGYTQNDKANKTIQVTGITLTTSGWETFGSIYKYVVNYTGITITKFVDVIPDILSYDIITSALLYPNTVSDTDSVTLYSKNIPTGNITITINIYE